VAPPFGTGESGSRASKLGMAGTRPFDGSALNNPIGAGWCCYPPLLRGMEMLRESPKGARNGYGPNPVSSGWLPPAETDPARAAGATSPPSQAQHGADWRSMGLAMGVSAAKPLENQGQEKGATPSSRPKRDRKDHEESRGLRRAYAICLLPHGPPIL
jgi:hypothetical protein